METTINLMARDQTRWQTCAGAIRRFLVIVCIGWWLGGFSFYTGVAIRVGANVLGGHHKAGLITQSVTNWINISGIAALAILLWNLIVLWPRLGRGARIILALSWLVMAAILIELAMMHNILDTLIDLESRSVTDEDRFHQLHRIYTISSTVQWAAGMIHTLWLAGVWSEPVLLQTEQNKKRVSE